MTLIGEPWQRCPRRKLTPLIRARLKQLKLDRTNKAAIVAGVICRRWYGVPLKRSGGKLPELIKIGFAVVNALEKAQ